MIKYRATTPKIRYTQHDNTKQNDTTQHNTTQHNKTQHNTQQLATTTATHSKNINKEMPK